MPIEVTFMMENFFPLLQLDCHLCVFVAVICCPVSVFCQVNVEVFRVFSIIVINCPEQFDRINVVSKGVKLWEVEIISDTELDKDMLVFVELFEGFVRATLPPSMLFADRVLLHRGYSISEPNA